MGWLEDTAKTIASVRQGSGVVGKLCTVGFFAFSAMGVGLYVMPRDNAALMQVQLYGVAIVGLVFLLFVLMCLIFAKVDPSGAGMESGDLMRVHLKRLEIATKDQGASVPVENVVVMAGEGAMRPGSQAAPEEKK